MESQNNQNPLELMAQLEGVVISAEEANKNKNLDGIKFARENYLNILKKCFHLSEKNIGGLEYKKVAEKLLELSDRFSETVKPYLMEIYFPKICKGDKKQ